MPHEPLPMDEEDTDAVIARHRRTRRRMGVAVVTPVVLVLALLAVWVTTTGRSCEERFWKGIRAPGGAASTATEHSWVVNPGSPTASLSLTISEPAEVWVDNESVGEVEETSLELSPGRHEVVTQTRRGGRMATTLTVEAGEAFEVFFNRANNKIRLYRVAANGQSVEVP